MNGTGKADSAEYKEMETVGYSLEEKKLAIVNAANSQMHSAS